MTGKCKCSVFTNKIIFQETYRYFLASLANVRHSSFFAFNKSREFFSEPKGSFRYLLHQLRNSFADVKTKPGELIHHYHRQIPWCQAIFFPALEHQPCLWQYPPPLSASPSRLSACASTAACGSCLFTLRSFHWGLSAVTRWRKSPTTLLLALSTKSWRIASFKLAMCLVSKWFRFGLFQQLWVPSEYQALPSE